MYAQNKNVTMCATLEEMNQIMEDIKSLERLKEETEDNICIE